MIYTFEFEWTCLLEESCLCTQSELFHYREQSIELLHSIIAYNHPQKYMMMVSEE